MYQDVLLWICSQHKNNLDFTILIQPNIGKSRKSAITFEFYYRFDLRLLEKVSEFSEFTLVGLFTACIERFTACDPMA